MSKQLEEVQEKEEVKEVIQNPQPDELMGVAENIEYHRVADFMGVDYNERQDPKLAEEIDTIYRWGQDMGGEDRIKALMAVKNLQKALGFTDKGKEAIKKLYKWIRLDTRRKSIETEMKLYES
jgi:hypothetical protein